MEYDKRLVLSAANKTAQSIRAERRELLAEWDSRGGVHRFFSTLLGVPRPVYHCARQQKTAERIQFKALFCLGESVSLDDHEIDVIRNQWMVEETRG